MPEKIASYYPFATDGVVTWASDQPWVETVVVLAVAAAVTERVRLGTAVLIAPQRNPVLLAKQVGSVDAVSGGRIDLGVGAGWLREEFDALDSDFDSRGPRLEEWIDLLRACWSGRPAPHEGHYRLPAGTLMLPPPARPVPILVGGHSRAALRRAGQLGDGWLGQQSVPELSTATLTREIDAIRATAARADRDPEGLRFVLRLVASTGRQSEIAAAIPQLRGGRSGRDHRRCRPGRRRSGCGSRRAAGSGRAGRRPSVDAAGKVFSAEASDPGAAPGLSR